jgi:hypothetical protein
MSGLVRIQNSKFLVEIEFALAFSGEMNFWAKKCEIYLYNLMLNIIMAKMFAMFLALL